MGLLNTPSLVLYDSKNRLKTFEWFTLLDPRILMRGAQLTALLPCYRMGRLLWWSLLIKLQVFEPATLLKRDSNTVVFQWNLQNFWEHLFWRISANNYFCSVFLMAFTTTCFFLLRLKLKWLKIGGAKVFIVAYIFVRIITCLIKIKIWHCIFSISFAGSKFDETWNTIIACNKFLIILKT